MRRFTAPLLGTLVLLAVALVTYQWLFGQSHAATLVIAEVSGDVVLGSPDAEEETVEVGRTLGPSDRLRTSDGASAVLSLGEATRITLNSGASLRVDQVDPEGVRLELEEGVLQATVRPGSGALSVDAGGRSATATDGDFSVGRDGDVAAVEVARGEVALTGFAGVDTLEAGQRAAATGTGEAVLSRVDDELLLAVAWPEETRTRAEVARVEGTTTPGALVSVRTAAESREVRADEGGRFIIEIRLVEGDNRIAVQARDVLGRLVQSEHAVVRDSQGPSFTGGVEYKR